MVSGEYYFSTLELSENGVLHIDASAGPVLVHVAGWASLAGEVDARPGELLRGAFGHDHRQCTQCVATTAKLKDARAGSEIDTEQQPTERRRHAAL